MSAIAAQLAVLPRSYTSTQQHHLTPLDTLLPLAPLTDIYPLTLVLSAFFANASLALTPVCGPQATYASAFKGIHPTIIVALPPTLARLHTDNQKHVSGTVSKYLHDRQLKMLENGSMPKATVALRDVRLIYTYDNSTTYPGSASLTAAQLRDLRIFTGAKFVFAHTAPKQVAGAVSQTNLLDYSNHGLDLDARSHLGPPRSEAQGCWRKRHRRWSTDGQANRHRSISCWR